MAKVKLGDVAQEYKETCKGSKDRFPIVGLEHLIPEEITLTMWDEEKENTFTKMFREGQVLFGRRRAYLKKAALAPFDGICSGDITVIEAIHDKVLPELLPFIIQNDSLFNFAVEKSAGSLSPRVKWENLKKYEFNLPDMKEQEKLAELLWAANDTKEAYKKLLSLTDDLVKTQFIEMFGDPETNPMGWDKNKFNIICNGIGDGLHGTPSYSEDGDYYFINGNNLVNGKIIITDSTQKVKKSEFEKHGVDLDLNTILVSINGTLGKTAFYNGEKVVLGKSACYCRIKEQYNKRFIYELLNGDYFTKYIERQATACTIKNVSLKTMRDFVVILPPIELQNQFVAFVRQIDKSKLDLQQTISSLENTINSLMMKYVG